MTLVSSRKVSPTEVRDVSESSSCALAGEHLGAAPGGDGDGGQRPQEAEDADPQQQPGEPDWNTDLVSREGPGSASCACSGVKYLRQG